MIYLASPYSHADLEVMEARFEEANRAAAFLIRGIDRRTFCPICHSHPIAFAMGDPKALTDYSLWAPLDEFLVTISKAMYVLKIPGWEISKGVAKEMEIATAHDLPIYGLRDHPGFPGAYIIEPDMRSLT